jgi:predicted aspartyl protease
MRFLVVAGALIAALGLGCGGGSNNGGTAAGAAGSGGQTVKGTLTNGVISVPVAVGGVSAMPFVVDTGAPLTLIDPNRFPSSGINTGVGQTTTLNVGGLHIPNVEVIGASPCGVMMCSDGEPAGLLGGDVLIQYVITIDYSPASIGFDVGAATPPAGSTATSTTFALQGGGMVAIPGTTNSIGVPATRIALDVTIEGASHPFVLDTGSSQIVLRPTLYDSLVADGRAQGTTNVSTVTGTTTQATTHLKTVDVAGATQSNVAAVRSPLNLDTLSAEVGHTVDGLLGGSYLSHYVTTIDYAGQRLTLVPGP